jgi:hypothetical protein
MAGMKPLAGMLLGLTLATAAVAQDVNLADIPESAAGKAKVEAQDTSPHPVISHDSSWAAEVVILIGGLFVAAILVGIFVPAVAPAVAHGHDDHDHDAHGRDEHSHDSHGAGDHAHGH